MIDLILNNIESYKARPLYVDLDQCYKQRSPRSDLVAALETDAGQIVKTHMPIGLEAMSTRDDGLLRVVEAAVVITVRRDHGAVVRSLSRWDRSDESLRQYEQEHVLFWDFWEGRGNLALNFDDLLDPRAMSVALQRIAHLTGTRARQRVVMPTSANSRKRIYLNKGLTRVLGRRAPRIDTTIHTLR